MIKKYFSTDGWISVKSIIQAKSGHEWPCAGCNIDLETTVDGDDENRPTKKISVFCDFCCLWYHLKCTGLKMNLRSL